MFILDLIIAMVSIFLFLLLVTQIIFPLVCGEPLFGDFRKSVVKEEIVKSEHELETVAETEHLKRVVTEINRRKAELEKE